MNNQEYLVHYGVKGMKWGVRRAAKKHAREQDKREYGMSKKEFKKAFRKSDRTNRDRVEQEYQNEFKKHKRYNELGRESTKVAYKIMDLDDKANGFDDSRRAENLRGKHQDLDSEMARIEREIGKRYVDKFNDATLADIKYSGSVERGREMLKKYRRDYELRMDGRIWGLYIDNDYVRPENMP